MRHVGRYRYGDQSIALTRPLVLISTQNKRHLSVPLYVFVAYVAPRGSADVTRNVNAVLEHFLTDNQLYSGHGRRVMAHNPNGNPSTCFLCSAASHRTEPKKKTETKRYAWCWSTVLVAICSTCSRTTKSTSAKTKHAILWLAQVSLAGHFWVNCSVSIHVSLQ